jgi:hypothetical protein
MEPCYKKLVGCLHREEESNKLSLFLYLREQKSDFLNLRAIGLSILFTFFSINNRHT